jgi:hypothetical protein
MVIAWFFNNYNWVPCCSFFCLRYKNNFTKEVRTHRVGFWTQICGVNNSPTKLPSESTVAPFKPVLQKHSPRDLPKAVGPKTVRATAPHCTWPFCGKETIHMPSLREIVAVGSLSLAGQRSARRTRRSTIACCASTKSICSCAAKVDGKRT